jgi:glycosyltransferase involved in cell wall biosynthesis
MKIGIEVQRLFRRKKFGIETSGLELIKTLHALEPNHELIVFAKDDEDRKCLSESPNLRIRTVAGKIFVDFEQIFLPLAARREHVDILHCTGNTAPFFSPAPVVQTLHDVIFMDSIPSGDSAYQRFGNHYRRRMVPIVTPKSKAVITVSQFEKERIIRRLGIPEEKVHVVYNGLNERRFNNTFSVKERNTVRQKYGLPQDFILFLGNEATRKNPGRVVEAYVRYAVNNARPMPLVAPGLSLNFILNKLKELGHAYDRQQILTPGYIADEDLPALYNVCKVFLFPSLSEGFGMPLVEAMACGAPVITSATSCLPEIAGNAALLINPLKADEIATAIATLASNEDLRQKKSEAGLANARRFSWERAAGSVLGIYQAVYADSRAAHKHHGPFYKHVFAARD